MSRAAATVVFEPSAAAVRVDDRFAACLRAVAGEAASADRAAGAGAGGAALAFAVEYAATCTATAGRCAPTAGSTRGPAAARSAEEVTETVVAAARRSTDERRVRHLGYLLAEAAVSPDLDADLVGRAVRTGGVAELAAAGPARRRRPPRPGAAADGPARRRPPRLAAWGAREDVADLRRAGLLDPPVGRPRPGAALPRLRLADLG